jgi:hypothetical protein
MAIKDWSTSPPGNENIADGFPENMPPSLVNDRARQVMAGVRAWYEDAAWTDLGHTVERVSATVFRVMGEDVRPIYGKGRRVKLIGNQVNYVTVALSTFDGNTVVTLSEGAVPLGNLSAAVSIINPLIPPVWGFRGAALTKATDQAIPNDAWTTLTWSGTLVGGFTLSGNRVVVPAGVEWVKVTARFRFSESSTGRRGIRVLRDGSVEGTMAQYTQPAENGVLQVSTGIIPVVGGDDLRVQAWHNQGGAQSVIGGADYITASFSVEAIA